MLECKNAWIREYMNSRMHGCMDARTTEGPCRLQSVNSAWINAPVMFADLGLAECTFGVEKDSKGDNQASSKTTLQSPRERYTQLKARLAPWKAHKKQLASPFQPLGAMPFRDLIRPRAEEDGMPVSPASTLAHVSCCHTPQLQWCVGLKDHRVTLPPAPGQQCMDQHPDNAC